MRPTEYSFTAPASWQRLARHASKLPGMSPDHDAGDALYALGYKIMGQSAEGRCALGHFLVWQLDHPGTPRFPRYALEIRQAGDESIVWIESLPLLWEFIRRYGEIGFLFRQCLPGDHEDDDDDDDEEDDTGSPVPGDSQPTMGALLPFHPHRPQRLN